MTVGKQVHLHSGDGRTSVRNSIHDMYQEKADRLQERFIRVCHILVEMIFGNVDRNFLWRKEKTKIIAML